MVSRREFSKYLLTGNAVLLASDGLRGAAIGNALMAQAPTRSTQDVDLLIKGGTVIDPGQQVHGLMDIAVKRGRVLEISRDIAEERALEVISAKDKIVAPGLIDLHVHCFDGVGRCINADHYCLPRGVTTVIDAGSSGHSLIANFRKYVMRSSITRIRALLNISTLAQVVGADKDWGKTQWLDPELTADAADVNEPDVVGIGEVSLGAQGQGSRDMEILKRALQAAEIAQLPLMVHIDGPYSPLSELLKMLRKGDVFTHFLNGHPNGILDSNGKVLSAAREARERGVFFDVAQGSEHLSFDVAEKCLQQGFLPDTISTDLNQYAAFNRVYDLPTMVSKFMALGLSLDEVIRMVTSNPPRIFDFRDQIGTLRPGSDADVSIFELQEGRFEFADSDGKTITGRQKLVSTAVVRHGQAYYNAL
jgi:dihydroorotase